MKKILFIIDSLACGGAEKSLVSLLALLQKSHKYELYLWMLSPSGPFVPLVPDGVRLVDQPAYSLPERVCLKAGQLLYSFRFRWNRITGKKENLAETLWKCQGWTMKVPQGDWDAVVAYQQGVPSYLLAEKFHGVKKLAWLNVDMFKAGYDIAFNSRFYRKVDAVVTVSAALHEMVDQKMPEFSRKYATVYDIIDPGITRKMAAAPVARIKTSQEELVLVTTGRLSPPKGYDLLVSAAGELKRRGMRFKWYIVGEGPEREPIEEWKREHGVEREVVLLGLQTNPYAYMVQADIYVQTSKFEGFGMTVSEAKILGKPVVSTNFEAINNQITDEQNGLVVKMDGLSIADAICRLASDDDLRNRIIENLGRENNMTSCTELEKVEKLLG